jgi:signal transduction histidine kinase
VGTVRRSRDAVVDAAVVALALADSLLRAIDEESGFVVSLVAALALVVRRRWPYVAFALTLPALYTADVLIAPLVAVYGVAVASRSRGPILLCAVIVAVGKFIPWPPYPEDVIDELHHLPEIIFSAVYAAAPVALGFLVQARRELSSHLAELTAGREREQHLVADRVLVQERSRLAREMHDVVSHKVSLIAVQAGALRVTATDPVVRESAEAIRSASVQTLEELRQMVAVLRTDGRQMADLTPQPGLADLPRLIRDSGLNATMTLDGVAERRWPEPVERAVYRTVQEALTNVGKHARAQHVEVRIERRGEGLEVRVADDGGGFDTAAPTAGFGVAGMRERAALMGGDLEIRSGAGGTVVRAILPGLML